MARPKTMSEYIDAAPEVAKKHLREIRKILSSAVPDATEGIKWGYPVFEKKRILFAFGAFKDHMNFMPTPGVVDHFAKELGEYKTGKGSIQFPYDKPLPQALIRKIAKFRYKDVAENDTRWM